MGGQAQAVRGSEGGIEMSKKEMTVDEAKEYIAKNLREREPRPSRWQAARRFSRSHRQNHRRHQRARVATEVGGGGSRRPKQDPGHLLYSPTNHTHPRAGTNR